MTRDVILKTLYVFYIGILIFLLFWNKSFLGYLFEGNITNYNWLNIIYNLGLDSLSIFFLILSCLLLIICVLLCWFWSYEFYFYGLIILFVLIILLNLFLVKDIFLIFFFFELVVLPLFLLVGKWGTRDRKIYSSYMLLVYTLIGSIFALFAFILIYSALGFSSLISLLNSVDVFDNFLQILLFFFIFVGFCVKVPVIPVHIWLPEAHVEAPTAGSVILAGIVLKLGFYVYIRTLVFTFIQVLFYFMSFIFILALVGLYISSFAALAQFDVKKIVAYSSISHMNFILIGLFANNLIALIGSFFMMFGHALVASALFSSVGILYDRYKTRLIFYFGGLVLLMPLWSTFFFVFILGNFSLPGTINFVGEFIIFLGSFFVSNFIILCCFLALFITLVCSLFLYVRLANGSIKVQFIRYFADFTRREYWLLAPIFLMIIVFGLLPNIFIDYFFADLLYFYMN